jgi:hypothetical protein
MVSTGWGRSCLADFAFSLFEIPATTVSIGLEAAVARAASDKYPHLGFVRRSHFGGLLMAFRVIWLRCGI